MYAFKIVSNELKSQSRRKKKQQQEIKMQSKLLLTILAICFC